MKSVRRIGTALAALVLAGIPVATTAPAATPASISQHQFTATVGTGSTVTCVDQPRLAVLHRSTGTLFGMDLLQPGVAAPGRVQDPAVLPLPGPATVMSEYYRDKGMSHVWDYVTVVANDGVYVAGRTLDENDGTVTPWTVRQLGTRGWGRMMAIVETLSLWSPSIHPRSLYALDRTGALYRYPKNSGSEALGRRVLLRTPPLRSLTLHSWSEERDILLGTTRSGALVAIVISGATRSSIGWVALRNRGWQSFDRLVLVDCGRLLAVDSAMNRAALYSLGYLRGGRTTIRPVGWSTGPWRNWVVAPYLGYGYRVGSR